MQADRPFLGVVLMLAFCLLAPLGDGIAKLLGGTVALGVLVLARFGVQAIFLVPIALRGAGGLQMPKGTVKWILGRTLLHIVGIALMISSLRYLPLADALAIAFVMPFILLALGAAFAGETVGPHRWGACTVGFIGTLLVIQPNFAAVGWPALLPLGVAIVFALFMLVTRKLAKRVDPIPLQAVSGLQASAIMLLVVIGTGLWTGTPLPTFDTMTWGLLMIMGMVGTLAHLFMTWSLRFAPSSTLAPMQYLEIPFATLIGWMMFQDLPNGLAAIGIVITIVAGLYIILRERQLSKAQAIALVEP